MTDLRVQFGENIRILRNRQAPIINQDNLAELIGVDKKTISRWENGKHWPDYSQLLLAANAFGVEPIALLCPMNEQIKAPPPVSDEAIKALSKAAEMAVSKALKESNDIEAENAKLKKELAELKEKTRLHVVPDQLQDLFIKISRLDRAGLRKLSAHVGVLLRDQSKHSRKSRG